MIWFDKNKAKLLTVISFRLISLACCNKDFSYAANASADITVRGASLAPSDAWISATLVSNEYLP